MYRDAVTSAAPSRPGGPAWRYTAEMRPLGHPLKPLCAMPTDEKRLNNAEIPRDRSRSSFLCAVILTALASCASTPPESARGGSPAPPVDLLPVAIEGERLQLSEIERITTIARTESVMQAQYERNQLFAAGIDSSTLIAIDTRLAWLAGDTQKSTALLDRLAQGNTASLDFVLREQEQHAEAEGDWLNAAEKLLAQIERAPRNRADEQTRARLFGYLLRASESQLRARVKSTANKQWREWLSMQLAYRGDNLDFMRWHLARGARPLSPPAPEHLEYVSDENTIEHVVLMLPLEGPLAAAGEAVVAGAVDQLYSLFPNSNQRPKLTTIDTHQFADISEGYQAAVQQGGDVVIGPLSKVNVAALAKEPRKPVPLIALNQIEGPVVGNQTQWLSFSLSPEDEANQIADVAFGQTCRNAIVIAMDSLRGRRLLDAFESNWRRLGGSIRGTLLADDPSATNEAMGKLLGSGSSDQRIRAVERAFDLPVDSRGRGRSDFECIFMLAPDPATARTWRPLLVFHMTGDIPVYATSAINDGLVDTRNRDLNGVRFVETPAMLPPQNSDRLGRLRALGSDALTLAQRWQQLHQTEQWVIRGQTGLLRRRENGSIERALELSTFDGAEVKRWNVE